MLDPAGDRVSAGAIAGLEVMLQLQYRSNLDSESTGVAGDCLFQKLFWDVVGGSTVE